MPEGPDVDPSSADNAAGAQRDEPRGGGGHFIRRDRTRIPHTGGAEPPSRSVESADGTGRPADDTESRGRYSVSRERPEFHAETQTEIHRGSKPGTRYARLTRSRERAFKPGAGAGSIRATTVADRPRTVADQIWRVAKRLSIGAPLSSARLHEQKLSKIKALPIFASDALSSTAYATEEILLRLILALNASVLGVSALGLSIPISIAIAVLLVIVATSYRQTIRAYPQGGGAYKVALENLGRAPGLFAGASLFVDYTLTVAVSTAAGVAAITSALPELHDERIVMAVVFVTVLAVLNLRGIRESGTIFAIPTYFFLVSFAAMIVAGFIRLAFFDIEHVPHEETLAAGTSSISIFLVLKAFSSGATALTGVEAISNGVQSFKEPASKNAANTLTWMAAILGTIFISVTVLAHQIEVQPSETKTVVAQIADAVFSGGPMFYIVQVATALILILAANTSFAGLPALASVMARDRFAPRLFSFRGDRLGFSYGIIVLAVASVGLLILYGADTHRLIPLYAVGVFIGFTLSQMGMVQYWRRNREHGWKRAIVINGVGAAATGLVTVVIAATKFIDGAWLTLAAICVLALLFDQIGRHYAGAARSLAVGEDEFFVDLGAGHRGQAVVMPIDEINRATVRAASYARSISNNVTALHVTDDPETGMAMRREWESHILDVPIVIVESEYRSLLGPVLAYVDALDRADPGQVVTVVLPEYIAKWPWQRWLHNQSSLRLKKALMERPHTVLIEVPYHLSAPEPQ